MTTCKYCEKEIFWNQEKSIMGDVWRAYDDEDCNQRHQCEDYKPPSKAMSKLKWAQVFFMIGCAFSLSAMTKHARTDTDILATQIAAVSLAFLLLSFLIRVVK